MKKLLSLGPFVLVLLFFWLFNSQLASASTTVSGNISSDTIWHTGQVYLVNSNLTIHPGITLTIEPGAIVKFNYGAGLTVLGMLSANGTSDNRIYFTSITDDAVGGDTNADGSVTSPAIGDWANIYVAGGTVNLNYSVVRFGGAWPQYTNIFQDGGTLNVLNSITEFSSIGFHINGGSTRIENSMIKNNQSGIEAIGSGSLILNNNTFTNNTVRAIHVSFDGGKSLISSGNTASGNGQNGITVSGAISTNQTWTDQMPYIISNLTVSLGKTLTINAGTKVKFSYGGFMTVSGDLTINGTLDNEVYFTSIKDDGVGGDTNGDGFSSGATDDWGQIIINSGGNVNMNHSVVRFGGVVWPYYSNIYLNGGSLNMSNSVISSGSTGLRIYDGWSNITNSTITNNIIGIFIEGGGVAISNSSIYNNIQYGIYNNTFVQMNAEHNWWGDTTGPYNFWNNDDGQGDTVSTFVDFYPWLNAPPSPISVKEPVIIVPGMLGSHLNRVSDGEEVWPNSVKMINPLTPEDNYLNELKLDNDGNEIIDINSSEIIESVFSLNQYGNIIQKFRDNGYELGRDLFVIPYDWRLDIEVSSLELDSVISEAVDNSPTGKVNLIVHSMGGLLVKDYLIRNGESSVNKVIFAGTPHLGAPKAFNLLNYGDDFDLKFLGLGLNKNKAKDIGQNMPSVYELLPSREYLTKTGSYVEDSGINLNYDETSQLMISDPIDYRNTGLLGRADDFHQSHDSWQPESANVYNLLGCREYDTIGSFQIDSDGSVDINSITGDGTVPLLSSKQILGENYYVLYPATKINHMGLVSDDRTINLIYEIILDIPSILPNGISQENNYCEQVIVDVRRLRFSTHSPVNLHVYDNLGNHTGLTSEGNIEMNIPDSNFVQVGDSSFVFVPDGAVYSIKIDAYATGSFDFKVKELINGEVENSVVYNDIPIDNQNLEADLEFTDINIMETLEVDRDGDGTTDAGYLSDGSWIPYSSTIQSTLDDLERIYLLGWTAGDVKKSLKVLLEASLPTAESIQSKGKKADGVLGTAFLKQLETEYNEGSINERAYNIIKSSIELLLLK